VYAAFLANVSRQQQVKQRMFAHTLACWKHCNSAATRSARTCRASPTPRVALLDVAERRLVKLEVRQRHIKSPPSCAAVLDADAATQSERRRLGRGFLLALLQEQGVARVPAVPAACFAVLDAAAATERGLVSSLGGRGLVSCVDVYFGVYYCRSWFSRRMAR
jgi:hypothetical protein